MMFKRQAHLWAARRYSALHLHPKSELGSGTDRAVERGPVGRPVVVTDGGAQ